MKIYCHNTQLRLNVGIKTKVRSMHQGNENVKIDDKRWLEKIEIKLIDLLHK